MEKNHLACFRLSLNVLTLSIDSHNVYTQLGVAVSVNGVAQVRCFCKCLLVYALASVMTTSLTCSAQMKHSCFIPVREVSKLIFLSLLISLCKS